MLFGGVGGVDDDLEQNATTESVMEKDIATYTELRKEISGDRRWSILFSLAAARMG